MNGVFEHGGFDSWLHGVFDDEVDCAAREKLLQIDTEPHKVVESLSPLRESDQYVDVTLENILRSGDRAKETNLLDPEATDLGKV